jgi:tRNA G18 (ribose-2'-O)-methylase SpoU
MAKFPIIVVLEDIRSALNVGAIFRTCDGAGISKLYLCGITPQPPHNRIPKTALGAVEFVAWEGRRNCMELLGELKAANYQILAVEQDSRSHSYYQTDYTKPTALVFGNEISGVSKPVLDFADRIIEIPMHGQKNSLNVATTVGIISYHAINNYQAAHGQN